MNQAQVYKEIETGDMVALIRESRQERLLRRPVEMVEYKIGIRHTRITRAEFDAKFECLDFVKDEKLTPLEVAEKTVITEWLLRLDFNKNRTRIELGITINTLNAKIQKYKIPGWWSKDGKKPKKKPVDISTKAS